MKGKFVIPLQNTTQQPLLLSLADRDVRAKLFDARWTATEKSDANDTRSTISEIALLRAQKAKLLGYPDYAAYVLYDQMAETPAAVEKFLGQLIGPAGTKARDEAKLIQAAIDADGKHFDLKPWDWERYAEKVRKAQYDLDDDQLKPYFEIDAVLQNGVFYAANKLYGITFKERHDLPVYHPDVRVFEVLDNDGSPLGLMYFDYFKRDNKTGGAWMSNFVQQSKLLGTKPVIYNVANFTKPAPGQPALISFDDVTTMFHEFGHALHGLFASQVYPSLSGTNVARDFVEFPSQFNEHWALYPEVLKHYAVNTKTHQPIPQALVDKIKKSRTWGQGYALAELLAASELDMQWHDLQADAPRQDVDAFETKALAASQTNYADVPPRYRSSYFLHIWANGYAAGYYAYQWTVMLDDDAYDWFEKERRADTGQRPALSRPDPVARAYAGLRPDVSRVLRQGSRHRTDVEGSGTTAAVADAAVSTVISFQRAYHRKDHWDHLWSVAPDDKMPPGIPYIVANEFAERFCFYGVNAILAVYMTQHLHFGDAKATEWQSLFKFGAYFSPLIGAFVPPMCSGASTEQS